MRDGRARNSSEVDRARAPSPTFSVWVTGFSMFLVLGVGLPLIIVTGSHPSLANSYAAIVLWIVCILCSARIAEIAIRRRAELLRLAFYVFCYVFIGISGLAQVVASHFPTSGDAAPPETVSRAATLFLVGFIAHELGYLLGTRRAKHRRMPTAFLPSQELPVSINLVIVRWLCAVGLLTTVIVVYKAGLTPFFTSREAADAVTFGAQLSGKVYQVQGDTSGRLWSGIYHIIPFMGLFLLLHAMRRDVSRRSAGYIALAAALGVCNLIVNNPVGNSRLWAGIVAFTFLSVFVDLRRPRPVFWTVVGMTVALLCLFPFADAFRRTNSSGFKIGNPLEALTTSGSLSAFQTGVKGLQYVDTHGVTWGRQLLGGLLTLIPHSFWPGKPVDTGNLIDPVGNRSATFWTEMHVNFGVVGAVVGLLVLGVVARRFDDAFVVGRSWALLIVPVLAACYFILLRGTLSAAVGAIAPLVFFFWLATWAGRPVGGDGLRTSLMRPGPGARVETATVG